MIVFAFADEPDEKEREIDKGITFITENAYYEDESGMYCFPVKNSDDVLKSSVFDGMVVTGKVILDIPKEAGFSVYRNGEEFELDESSISRTGSYVINCNSNGAVIQIMTFMIVFEETGKIESYGMPPNFAVDKIVKDGEEQRLTRTEVDFTEEGLYSVEYSCISTGVKYNLDVKIDHTPPILQLKGVKNGSANGPVDITDELEKDARLVITRNGKDVTDEGTRLTKSGNYRIVVADNAGNTNTYQFTIQVYFNTNSIIIFIILILGILALIFYIYKARTGLKVR